MQFSDLDVFYISYDEPNCEKHWADLLGKVPWAKRVHGVFGSDAAHKECARQTKEERFVSIDADNIIDPRFFDKDMELDSRSVYSWSARNVVNGLVYGNGGIKCWPTVVVNEMRTHEVAETPQAQVDFCWDQNYIQMDQVFSVAHINGSPMQAWRSGFREGVKMSLDQGVVVDRLKMESVLHRHNYERLQIWCSIGADMKHGLWAIYGARMGVWKTFLDKSWDFTSVRDFEWLNAYWLEILGVGVSEEALKFLLQDLGITIRNKLHLPIEDFDAPHSRWFKSLYRNPSRTDDTRFLRED